MRAKLKTLTRLDTEIAKIYNDKYLGNSILKHFSDLNDLYKTDPKHFKILFRRDRFMLSTYLAIHYYTCPEPSVSDLKRKCLALNLVSNNTIYSLLDYFIVNNDIILYDSNNDKRTSLYSFTTKGKEAIKDLIRTMIPAIQVLKPDTPVDVIYDDKFLSKYFERYAEIAGLGYVSFTNVEHIDLFIKKDAGHLILLNIYFNQDRVGNLGMSVTNLSKICSVSRNHIFSIINSAVDVGMILKTNTPEKYVICQSFNDMVEKYMSTYFMCIIYALGLL